VYVCVYASIVKQLDTNNDSKGGQKEEADNNDTDGNDSREVKKKSSGTDGTVPC